MIYFTNLNKEAGCKNKYQSMWASRLICKCQAKQADFVGHLREIFPKHLRFRSWLIISQLWLNAIHEEVLSYIINGDGCSWHNCNVEISEQASKPFLKSCNTQHLNISPVHPLFFISRFCLSETSCPQEDHFPPNLCVKVNGKPCNLPVSPNGPSSNLVSHFQCNALRAHRIKSIDVWCFTCRGIFLPPKMELNQKDPVAQST